MKCPYCDDTIHPMAKFCPKCGLPLKEDATIQGSYVVDDSGPSPWVIVAGAAGIAGIALCIGWMSGQGHGGDAPKVDASRLPPPAPMSSYALPGAGAAYQPQSTQFQGPPLDYNPHVRWAYVPPPQNLNPQPVYNYQPQPVAPTNMGTLKVLMRPLSHPVGEMGPPQPVAPEIPALPLYAQMPAGSENGVSPDGVAREYTGFHEGPPAPASWQDNDRATYVWDPVQERWALKTDRTYRKASGRVVMPRPGAANGPAPGETLRVPDASPALSGG